MNRPFAYFLVAMTIMATSMRLGAQLNCSGGSLGCPQPATSTGLGTGAPVQFGSVGLGQTPTQAIDIVKNGNNGPIEFQMTNSGVQTNDDVETCLTTQASRLFSYGISRNSGLFTLTPASCTLGAAGSSTMNAVTGDWVFGATATAGVTSTTAITTANLQFRGNSVLKDGTPTCSGGGCVVVANSINSAGSVTTTTTGAADITITFSANFQHAPVCIGDNATTGNLLRATTEAVGSFHLQGVTAAGDTLGYVCLGN